MYAMNVNGYFLKRFNFFINLEQSFYLKIKDQDCKLTISV